MLNSDNFLVNCVLYSNMAYQKTLTIRDTMREIAGLPCDHVSKTCSENRSQDELSQEEVLARSRDLSWRSAIVRRHTIAHSVAIGGKPNWVIVVAGKNCPAKVFILRQL